MKDLVGKRVELISMKDPYPVMNGEQGEIVFIDSLGTLHVKWDNGRSLGLVPGEDIYKILS